MSFASLGLSEPLVRAVSERGYTTPTPIQQQAIPAVLSGGDLLAGAQTGTGKTAGFTLPLLQRLVSNKPRRAGAIRALVLTPTRELAAQVEESVRNYGQYVDLKSMVMFGGVSINPQIAQLKRRLDILVATPGRLLDHVQQKTVDLSQVEILVLDEADRMLDMGFIRDIKKVLALLPKQRQNLLFSATFSDEIKALADGLLNNPALIEVARRNTTTELVEQKVMLIEQKAKRHLLAHLIKTHNWFQVLVFTRTKHGANRLAEQLTKGGINSLAIHGNKSQNARTRALAEFKAGTLQVLVATDIAARGLDISELPHVVNFELPNVPEDYVHRIGRTGRAGSTGEALSLVDREEMKYLSDIEKLIKKQITRLPLPAFEIPVQTTDDTAREPRPARAPRNGSPRKQGATSGKTGGEASRSKSGGQTQQPRRSGQTTTSSQPRKADQAQASQGQGQARRDGQVPRTPSRGGGGNGGQNKNAQPRHGARNNQPRTRYPRDENGDANGNVIPAPVPDRDGNHTPQKSGLRGALARGMQALRKLG